jgi:hypothetical protein
MTRYGLRWETVDEEALDQLRRATGCDSISELIRVCVRREAARHGIQLGAGDSDQLDDGESSDGDGSRPVPPHVDEDR